MKKCKVLHIIPGFQYGGIESRLLDWYDSMNYEAVQFDVLKTTPDTSNYLVDRIRKLGGNVFSIHGLGAKTFVSYIKETKEILKKGNYDVIHAHSLRYGGISLLLAKKMGIKTRVLHSRTSNASKGENHFLIDYVLKKMAINNANHYFACSDLAKNWAFGEKTDVTIINNGTHTDLFAFNNDVRKKLRAELSITDEEKVIGFVGRFTEAKNLGFLLEVYKSIVSSHENVKLMLIGDGPLQGFVNDYIEKHNISDKVLAPGSKSNVNDWINCFDIFCLPSLFEGFPGVAVEAQSNGLPCIFSDKITKTVMLTDNASMLPLVSSLWSEKIIELLQKPRIVDAEKIVAQKGYDIVQTAKWLEEFYLTNRIDNNN